jgi:16S rRNA (adenine1518-N6/adenine1519-N6)-dimethyltransferase
MNTRYNAADIEVLSGLDPVKRRPGMYTDTSRPNHLAQEVIDNAVDEALAGHARGIEDLHLMLQREVVDRMVARPGSSEYGRLSVMLQYRFGLEKLFQVPPSAFRPAPQVESAVVRLIPMAKKKPCDERLLSQLVGRAFMQRRKTLRNALRTYFDDGDFAALGIRADARAQELAPEDFARMANYVAARSEPS